MSGILSTDTPPLPSQRVRSALISLAGGKRRGPLSSYLRLQSGTWWEWGLIWVLQNSRYCPVYILPLLIGGLVDRLSGGQPASAMHQLPWVLAVTLGLCVVTVVSDTCARMLLSRIGRTLTAGLRGALLRRMNRLEFTFHDQAQVGALQNKFTLDMGRLEGFQTFVSESLMMYGTVLVTMLVIVWFTNGLLLLVIAAAVPLNLLIVRVFWNRISALNEAYRNAEGSFMASLHEALNGLRTTRALATEAFVEQRVSHAAGEVAKRAIRLDFMSNLFGSGSWAVSTFLNMGVVGAGVWLASGTGHQFTLFDHTWTIKPITLGEFTILMSYYGIVAGAISAVLGGLPAVAAAGDAINSLSQLYRDEDEPHVGPRAVTALRGEVKLENVSFAYPGADGHCLNGLNLHLPIGTSLALVGPSGSGKSTVASLILGFYQPISGKVIIDGEDLTTLNRRSLRQHIGVVSQEVALFQDTILANIAWGDDHPDEARAHRAALTANAMEFIGRMPNGMRHVLGDRGAGLSGGQRQRLAIARALYRDPRLLILDEATSALDQESERLVQKALDELKRDRTTLIIAHRLSTVRSADRIAVIKNGTVAESGTYDELMALDGEFRKLAQEQLK